MWVRASAAPPSAAKRRRALGLYSASGGRAGGLESISRWVRWLRLVPKDEFAGP